MSDLFLEFMAESSEGMVMAAIAAAPVALLVLLIDRTVGKRLAPRYRCWMWMLVALRLLMPVAPGSPVSAQSLWRFLAWESESTHHQVEQLAVQSEPKTVAEFMASDRTITAESPAAVAPSGAVPAAWDCEEIIVVSLLLLWLVGMVVVMLRAVVASVRFAWRLRAIPCVEDQAIIDTVLRVCDQVGVGRRPQVKYVPGLPAPALFGLFRPILCLPESLSERAQSNLSPAELRMIVIHEAMHVRRRDAYLSWLLTAVRAIHWFNPVAWFTIQQIEIYREQACDDAVRRFTEPEEQVAYADLLLRFASGRPAASLGLLGLWFARPAKRLAARIEVFSHPRDSQRMIPKLATWLLLGLLATVGLTDAATSSDASSIAEKSNKRQLPVFTASPAIAWNAIEAFANGPESVDAKSHIKERDLVEERDYDVSQALEKLSETAPDVDGKAWLQTYLLPPFVKSTSVFENGRLEGDVWSLELTLRDHRFFTGVLRGIAQAGAWQVTTEIRVIQAEHFEALGDIDWSDAEKFALPPASTNTPKWPEGKQSNEEGKGLSLSVDSISWQYAPFLALVIDQERMKRFIKDCQNDKRTSYMSGPKFTVFSGVESHLHNEAYTPFVVGVQTIKGAYAVAHQPEIAVLPEGMRIDVQPLVIAKEMLDLRCRITTSEIHGVNQANLPGLDVAVQTPNASRHTISARCTVSPGQTLLIAAPKGDGEVVYYAVTSQWFADEIKEVAEGPGFSWRP